MTQEKRLSFTSDHLIDQIIEGRKTATACKLDELGYCDEWDSAMEVGTVYTVYDSKRVAKCKIRITMIQLCRWDNIPEWLWQGETNDDPEEFREDHYEYFDRPDSGDYEFAGSQFELVETLV